jgi:hypothetical protein
MRESVRFAGCSACPVPSSEGVLDAINGELLARR